MFKLFRRIRDWLKLKNVSLMFFSLIILHICGFIMCYQNLTFRLPRGVVPVSYALQLHPDFSTELFNGEVAIAIEIFGERRFIAVHAKDLTIFSTKLTRYMISNMTAIIIGDVEIERILQINEYDMFIVETRSIIMPGNYQLIFQFHGSMSKDKTGFFMNHFVDPNTGEYRKMAATRFEPTHARRAFPCFDEPDFKAVFHIRLIQPNIARYLSISNMPMEHVDGGHPFPELTTVYFEPTPPMSSYLVACVITDLGYLEAVVPDRWDKMTLIPIRAWTIKENTPSLDLVLHLAFHVLKLYMRIFRSNYPLPKIDTVAIPGMQWDVSANWGLITYGESSMLWMGRANSVTDLKISTNHIIYGLVHMWFDNFVTIKWWDDVWLPKSFATYMQYYTADYHFPEWRESDNFLVDAKFPSMRRDALVVSEPIIVHCNSSQQIDKLFQSIPYRKGASIIRMLHYIMGETNFFHGVSYYLHMYQLKTATTLDFLATLQNFHIFAHENLTRFVDTWTRQPGYPVLNVERIADTYFINQTRFVWNNVTSYNTFHSPYLFKWDLPIFYVTSVSPSAKRMFLPYNSRRIQFVAEKQVAWVKFNSNSIGYFTVNYDVRMWQIFVNILNTKPETFQATDRADLINDAFVNADAGRTPYDVPMSMLNCMKSELDHTTWQVVADKLSNLHTKLQGTPTYRKFEEFVINLITSIYQTVGWRVHQMNSFLHRRLRITILKIACAYGMRDCLEEVTRRFLYWIDNPSIRPHPDLREIVYYYGMSWIGGLHEWNVIYGLFMTEPDYREREKLMISLTAIRDSTILINYLEIAKNHSIMSSEEYLKTIHAATSNPIGPFIVWDFYKANWIFLASRYSNNDERFARLIIPVTSTFRDTYKLHEILQFFKDYPNGQLIDLARKEATEIIRNNLVWMEMNYPQLKNWLEAF